MQENDVKRLMKEEFDRNYLSGAPRIPPHTHNGVDNLQLPAKSIEGGVVTQVVAGSNVTVTPSSGKGVVTISASSGGGGGTPGGADKEVQFNNSGAFDGDPIFTWDKVNTLTLDDASATGTADGAFISGGTSRLNIITASKSDTTTKTGDIRIETGTNTGTYSYSGNIVLQGGSTNGDYGYYGGNISLYGSNSTKGKPGKIKIFAGTSNATNSTVDGANMTINAGNSGATGSGPVATGYGDGGNITLNAGSTSYSYSGTIGGSIYLNTTFGTGGDGNSGGVPNGNTSGKIIMNVHYSSYVRMNCRAVPYGSAASGPNLAIGNKGFGGGQGVISIQNARTNPTASVTNGGILYVSGGALVFRGAGGTVTTIAPS